MHRASQFHTILHHSTVIQGNSFGVLFNGLLAELPAILDSLKIVAKHDQWITSLASRVATYRPVAFR